MDKNIPYRTQPIQCGSPVETLAPAMPFTAHPCHRIREHWGSQTDLSSRLRDMPTLPTRRKGRLALAENDPSPDIHGTSSGFAVTVRASHANIVRGYGNMAASKSPQPHHITYPARRLVVKPAQFAVRAAGRENDSAAYARLGKVCTMTVWRKGEYKHTGVAIETRKTPLVRLCNGPQRPTSRASELRDHALVHRAIGDDDDTPR